MEITGMVIPKLPILAPRRGGHVLLLPLALHVGLFILRRVENGFGLLGCHTGNWLGRRCVCLTLGGRGTRRLALSASAPATTTSSSAAPTSAFFLPPCALVIPPGVGICDRGL